MLFREKINFCFPKSSSIKISNFSNQIQIIEDIFSTIWKNFELGDKYLQFIKAIKSYNEITSKHDKINSYDLLITGSPVKIPIRAEAAYALSKIYLLYALIMGTKPVLQIIHLGVTTNNHTALTF